MITVSKRTDEEMLRELLSDGGEYDELEFKATYDFSNPHDELEFVKDALAMFNHYPGGYLVIGVTNDRKPSDDQYEIDWEQFDGAKLTEKVKKFVDAPLTVYTGHHEIDGHQYCLICCLSPENGLPVPFSKTGQYTDNKGNERFVFRAGDIVRRNGAKVHHIEYSQWPEILEQHDKVIRHEERERIDELIECITAALNEKATTPPLEFGMDEKALELSLSYCFEQNDTKRINRFIDQASIYLGKSDNAIIVLAAVAAYAASYREEAIFKTAIDRLYEFYQGINNYDDNAIANKLAIILSVYEIGCTIEISEWWGMISPLVNRQSNAEGPNYIYASWIRECQVYLYRRNILGKMGEKDGQLISRALTNINEHPILSPDIKQVVDNESDNNGLSESDNCLLDALCAFDFLYCICVFVAGKGEGEAYPAFVGFSPKRIQKIDRIMFGENDKARRALLPGYTDEQIASGLIEFRNVLCNEAMGSSSYYWSMSCIPNLEAFIDKYVAK